MSEHDAARDHYLAQQDALPKGDAPAWVASLRADARGAFADAGLPSTKQEEWRYTNVAPLAKLRPAYAPAAFTTEGRVGSLAALLRDDASVLEGRLGAIATPKRSPFADLNTAFLTGGAVVHAARDEGFAEPVHVRFGANAGTATHPRLLVVADSGSRVCVVSHFDASGPGLTNAVIEVHAAANSRVDVVIVQNEPAGRFHTNHLYAHQERDSRVATHTLTLGSAWTRNDAELLLAGEGAFCRLDGLFVGGGTQLIDNHTLVDHAVPHCESTETYKGVLGGKSRGVFRGRVVVRPDAQKTSALQSNPNLLLGRGAEIDTKPQLEIYADDVKCSHGSTIGQLAEDALFYLRSRGVGASDARDMLTRAFAAEVLEALPSEALAEGLETPLREALKRAREDSA